MKRTIKILLLLMLPFTVLAQDPVKPDTSLKPDTLLHPDAVQQDTCIKPYLRDNMNAVLWQQHSAEYKALTFQAYNFARWRMDELLKQKGDGRPKCIIVDIDETILDNTSYRAFEVLNGLSYADSNRIRWTHLAIADTIPGSAGFLKYASSKGVEIMYITNRSTLETAATLKNLKKFGFPNADPKHLLTKTSHDNKALRRRGIANRYQVLLLIGDDLNDFSDVFYEKDAATRLQSVSKMRDQFGKNFIILPNPMYGSWESDIYDNKKDLEEPEKANMRMEKLKSFEPKPVLPKDSL